MLALETKSVPPSPWELGVTTRAAPSFSRNARTRAEEIEGREVAAVVLAGPVVGQVVLRTARARPTGVSAKEAARSAAVEARAWPDGPTVEVSELASWRRLASLVRTA